MQNKLFNFVDQNFHFLDLMPVGAFILDQEYEVQHWNSCLERWSKTPKETILGTSLLKHFPRLKEPQYSLRIDEVFQGGPPVVFSSKIHKFLIPCPIGVGEYQTQQTMVTSVYNEEEDKNYALFTIQDVTDTTHQLEKFKAIKENLLKKEIDLGNLLIEIKKINIDLEQFAQIVSHDLKAPLRGIQNLANWILSSLKDKVPEDSKNYLSMLKEQVVRMQTMIDGILDYSKSIGGEHKMELVDLKALIREIIEEVNPPSGFTIDMHPDLPNFYTHRTKLKQVFSNLIGNAIKHHDREDGKVEIEAIDKGEDFEFIVKDDGPGIDPLYQKNIYVIFQTGGRQPDKENTGIGLAIVKKIIQDINGEVRFTSKHGVGTQFKVIWPKNAQVITHKKL